MRKAEQRRHPRHPLQRKIRILWEDPDGQNGICRADLVNVSAKGLKILVDLRLPLRTSVSVNDEETGIMGRGSVRYCNFEKGRYAIGLEFSSGTGWKTPTAAEAITEEPHAGA